MDITKKAEWTFLSNHAHVLIYVSKFPVARIRDVATAVGITERFAQKVLKELVDTGYLATTRNGRRNEYSINQGLNFRHPLEEGSKISALLSIFK